MRRLTPEERATRRALRRELRAWRRYRLQAFEAWAARITAEDYLAAELIRPHVDDASGVIDDLQLNLSQLTQKGRA